MTWFKNLCFLHQKVALCYYFQCTGLNFTTFNVSEHLHNLEEYFMNSSKCENKSLESVDTFLKLLTPCSRLVDVIISPFIMKIER